MVIVVAADDAERQVLQGRRCVDVLENVPEAEVGLVRAAVGHVRHLGGEAVARPCVRAALDAAVDAARVEIVPQADKVRDGRPARGVCGKVPHLFGQFDLPAHDKGGGFLAAPVANDHPAAERLDGQRAWAVRHQRRRGGPCPLCVEARHATFHGLQRVHKLCLRHRPRQRVAVCVVGVPHGHQALARRRAHALARLQVANTRRHVVVPQVVRRLDEGVVVVLPRVAVPAHVAARPRPRPRRGRGRAAGVPVRSSRWNTYLRPVVRHVGVPVRRVEEDGVVVPVGADVGDEERVGPGLIHRANLREERRRVGRRAGAVQQNKMAVRASFAVAAGSLAHATVRASFAVAGDT